MSEDEESKLRDLKWLFEAADTFLCHEGDDTEPCSE